MNMNHEGGDFLKPDGFCKLPPAMKTKMRSRREWYRIPAGGVSDSGGRGI